MRYTHARERSVLAACIDVSYSGNGGLVSGGCPQCRRFAALRGPLIKRHPVRGHPQARQSRRCPSDGAVSIPRPAMRPPVVTTALRFPTNGHPGDCRRALNGQAVGKAFRDALPLGRIPPTMLLGARADEEPARDEGGAADQCPRVRPRMWWNLIVTEHALTKSPWQPRS
jgi:hypothetical protein